MDTPYEAPELVKHDKLATIIATHISPGFDHHDSVPKDPEEKPEEKPEKPEEEPEEESKEEEEL